MARHKFEIKRVLFVNGVRVNLRGGSGSTTQPTQGLLEGLEACHQDKKPWGKFWVEKFTVRTVVEEEDGGVYARYDVRLVSQRAAIDEVAEFTEKQFRYLQSRKRKTKAAIG